MKTIQYMKVACNENIEILKSQIEILENKNSITQI
jgi:hypothetical protein